MVVASSASGPQRADLSPPAALLGRAVDTDQDVAIVARPEVILSLFARRVACREKAIFELGSRPCSNQLNVYQVFTVNRHGGRIVLNR